MLKNSKFFTEAIKADLREMYARVTINNIVYDDSVINSIEYDTAAFSGEQFDIGSSYAASVKVVFSEVIETLVALDKVTIEIGAKREEFSHELKNKTNVQVGRARMGARLNLWNSTEDVEYSLLGEFYISDHVDINYNDKITTIQCKDKVIFLEDVYESELDYPTDIRNVIVEIANKAGVEIDTLNIEELESIEITEISGYTYRESLGFIAQLLVGYVHFNQKGLLQIRTLVDSGYEISTDEYFSKGLQKNGIRYKVRGITCTIPADENTEELFVGSKKGPQLTIENPIMTQEFLDGIFAKLEEVDYYPYDLNWRGNPALETGDLITVYDVEGNRLKVPNLSYQLNYNGGLSAESSADTKSRTDVVASGRKTFQQQIHTTNQTIKETASNLENAFKDAQDKITGNQGGYLVQRLNEDGKPYEFLVMDTEDINSAMNVIRLNQQGIGFSQNGYNGPFGVAITIDGQIVADYITAGTLSAELIKSGFNDIDGNGVRITGNGLVASTGDGGYANFFNGGMAVYSSAVDRIGFIGGAYSEESQGLALYANQDKGIYLARRDDGTTLVPYINIPPNFKGIQIGKNMHMEGNNIVDASAVRTRNDINESVLRTWSSGESFVGGTTGARLGYIDGTSYQSVLLIPKEGAAVLSRDFEASVISATRFNVKGTNQYLLNNSNGGGSFIDSQKVGLGVGTPSSWHIKIEANTDGVLLRDEMDVNAQRLVNVGTIIHKNGSGLSTQFVSTGGVHAVGGSSGTSLGARLADGSVSNLFRIYDSGAHISYRDINMAGNNITNTSDIRLKKNIKLSEKDAIKEVMRWSMIEYEFNKDIPRNKDMPDGILFGISAQSAPSLQIIDDKEDSYLSVSLTTQINVLSLAMQQLIKKVEKLEGGTNE